MNRRVSSSTDPIGTGPYAAAPIGARLFGRFEVRSSEGVPLELSCAKSRELLAYLLVHRERAHRRVTVADCLWGERCGANPRRALRQALWRLQTVLGKRSNGGPQLVQTLGAEWVRINPAVPLALDVAHLEHGWRELVRRRKDEPSPIRVEETTRTLDLYRGDLLEGEDWTWCLFERERLRGIFLAMSGAITDWCAQNGEFALGVRMAIKTLKDDPAREKTHQDLMLLYALAGDRTSALRQFSTCAAVLRTELDVEPSRETHELLERIRSDRPLVINAKEPPSISNQPVSSRPYWTLGRLKEMRHLLARIRREVDVEIEQLERGLATEDARRATTRAGLSHQPPRV